MGRRGLILGGVAAAGLAGAALWRRLTTPTPLRLSELARRHAMPLPRPDGPLATYHLGHSLVGRDMPAMLAQIAGHDHAVQLGWGASLKQHWDGDVPGFDAENDHPRHQPARQALGSGAFPAVVMTEMVELRDAIRWHDSARHLGLWAALARKANPAARLFLYESWHRLDDPAGWETRIAADLPTLWMGQVLAGAMAMPGVGTIHLIPAGQVLAQAVKRAEGGGLPGMTARQDFFARTPEGQPDTIHPNDAGNYVVALAHFATIYQREPPETPALVLASGAAAALPGPEARAILRRMAWDVVRRYPATGIAPSPGAET